MLPGFLKDPIGSERHDPTVTVEKLGGSWEGLQGFLFGDYSGRSLEIFEY